MLLIDHGLAGFVREVNNGEAAMAQADIGIDVTTLIVRAAPRQPVHHALNARPVWCCTIEPDFTAYATHINTGTRDDGRGTRNVTLY